MGRRSKLSLIGDYKAAFEKMKRENARPIAGRSAFSEEDDAPEDIKYTQVTEKTLGTPRCACCSKALKPGEWHWKHADGRQYTWWCVRCMKKTCGYTPPNRKK